MRIRLTLFTVGVIAAALPSFSQTEYTGVVAHEFWSGEIGIAVNVPSPEAAGVVVYDNFATFSGFATTQGGAVLQGTNGITRLLADNLGHSSYAGQKIARQYFTFANLNADAVTARPRLRYWFSDGAGGAPGTYYNDPAAVGFTFNPITVAANTVAGFFFDLFPTFNMNLVSGSFWAGITFDNNNSGPGMATLAQLNLLGQGMYGPPAVGSSADTDFLTTAAGSFFTTANPAGALRNSPFGGAPIANYGWRIEVVPEPSTYAAVATGLLGIVGLRRRRK